MAGWQVTEEAVAAMNNMSAQLQEKTEIIHQETEKVKSSFDENQDGLGAHSAEIRTLIDEVECVEKEASVPVKKLALRLQRAALIRQKHIDSNHYGKHSSASGEGKQGAHTVSASVGKASEESEFHQRIAAEGQKAIKLAWEREKELVLQGKGTRDWTVAQQQELISEGKISGFEGQHMYDKSTYPEYAGDPNNIQWLTYEEHFFGAHQEYFPTSTNGYFDPKTGKLIPFKEGEKPSVPIIELTDKIDPAQAELLAGLGRDFGYGRKADRDASKDRHKGEKSNRRFGKGD